MAIQISTGSLIALGVSAGDVATIFGLSKRIGNWWSAASGDDEFLSMLDEDEFNILRRRGLIDLPSFNKRWRKEIRLYANGKPTVFKDKDADKVLEQLNRFTATMVCVVTALDTFTTSSVTRNILSNVLKELLRTSAMGEELLATQYSNRLNSWRSLSCLRGFLTEAEQVRRKLLEKGVILEGLMPVGESKLMEEFLLWLLSGLTDKFTTSSSDIAGFATCLSHLGIDTLSVEGLGYQPRDTSCRLVYSRSCIVSSQSHGEKASSSYVFERELSTTVSLLHPEESVVYFPTSLDIHNRCRQAWRAGQRAASYVALGVIIPTDVAYFGDLEVPDDLRYSFINRGTEPQRVSVEMQELASAHAFVINQELLVELQDCLGRESLATLTWLSLQTSRSDSRLPGVTDPGFDDDHRVNMYCIFQSFFMGYYYGLFIRVVDASSLKTQTVEGNWGFRSTDFLRHMRLNFWKLGPQVENEVRPKSISRQTLLEVLAMLFLNYPVRIASTENREEIDRLGDWCLGIVAKKTILVNSLVNNCYSPGDIGRFVLLDVDVSGIPRDHDGLIRPGLQGDYIQVEKADVAKALPTVSQLTEASPAEDASVHIEADWDGNPDKMLLCARYRGRRFMTLSPALADPRFCRAYVEPVEEPESRPLDSGIPCTISNLINGQSICVPDDKNVPVLVQVCGKPVLRYIAVAFLSSFFRPLLASNCIHAAERTAAKKSDYTLYEMVAIIASQGHGYPLVYPELSDSDGIVYAVG
jgi:hypothetical protein